MKKNDLLAQTIEDVNFYVDKNDKQIFYAEFLNNAGKTEFVRLNSDTFKSFLFAKSFKLADEKAYLNPDDAIQKLKHLLLYYKTYAIVDVNIRTAGNLKDGIEYDLQLDNLDTVKISPRGWRLSPRMKKFIVPKISLPQVAPRQTNDSPLKLLKPFVNLRGDMFLLFVIWLVQAFSHRTHFALLVLAEKGSGKSTLSKIIKRIIDPCSFEVSPIPDKRDDLVVLLYNSFLCCFDNVSNISADVSDIFCGAVTGTASIKRALYTDSELSISRLHNTLVINGIGVVPGKDDLAERMLLLKLNKLKPQELKGDSDIWTKFESQLPYILGSIFNTLSKAMTEIKNIKPQKSHRMADAFEEMLAIAKALGISEERFYEIFYKNLDALQQAHLSSPVVEAVKEYASLIPSRKIEDTAEKIFENVYENFSGDKSLLPNSASHFSKQLDEKHSEFLKSGLRINIDDTGAKATRISIIKRKK